MEELNPLWLSLMPFNSISWHINQSTNQSINKHILRTYCGPALRMDSKYASPGPSYQGDPYPAGKMSRLCQPLPSPATVSYRLSHTLSLASSYWAGNSELRAHLLQHTGKAWDPMCLELTPDHYLPFNWRLLPIPPQAQFGLSFHSSLTVFSEAAYRYKTICGLWTLAILVWIVPLPLSSCVDPIHKTFLLKGDDNMSPGGCCEDWMRWLAVEPNAEMVANAPDSSY